MYRQLAQGNVSGNLITDSQLKEMSQVQETGCTVGKKQKLRQLISPGSLPERNISGNLITDSLLKEMSR